MIGLPVASMIGGMMTPAGSSLNLMSLNLLEQLTGTTVTFVQWMICAIPLVIVLIPISWYILIYVYKPSELSSDDIKRYVDSIEIPSTFDFSEKYVLSVVILMLIFWILSSWIPAFNITLIAIIGFVFLFIPKIEILSWNEFLNSVEWTAIFLVASIITVGECLVANGISEWLVATVFPSTIDLPLYAITFIVSIFVFLMLIIVPVAPALVPILAPPLVGLAGNIGVSPVFLILTLDFCIVNCFFLPLDTVPLLTYMTGYYKMSEMPKSTALIQLSIAILVSAWLPFISRILGLL
jgi:sodium-dependent dicarboxylate transporter 2/3/5